MTSKMPAVFVGHGSPMNALPGSPYADGWRAVGASLLRPKAILAISAHWETDGTAVTAQAAPPTIHDFRGFPQALFDMRYPAPGAPELAARIGELIAPVPLVSDHSWGFDHGAWSVLAHMYPDADVPVAQLSLDRRLSPGQHYELAQKLQPLRDEGVLILGSGDIVHSFKGMRQGLPQPWAERFDTRIQAAIAAGDTDTILAIDADEDARLSVPDREHYWPLLYVAAQRQANEPVRFFNQGIDMGAISMSSFVVG
ncbi:MAG: 4,5-DOPA dioxygenase extradiol [Pseudomonadota bacterium]|nr:4,5-DOPA dioxygenase extradiol [Pseudomonadota bacterium]